MELLSYGIERKVFTHFFKGSFDYQNKKMKEPSRDKKIDATYYIQCRYKCNGKKYKDSNNEVLHLEFDSNLSPDFYHTEIDFNTKESLTIALLKTEQGNFGRTHLVISVQYINTAQELFENEEHYYCDTLPGTIPKRLEAYKTAFDMAVNEITNRYRKDGFKVNMSHIINNFAGYLYYENKKRPQDKRFLSEFSLKADINKLLILYSIFHDDCFWKGVSSWNSCLHTAPYSDISNRFDNIEPTTLVSEQALELERLIQIKTQTKGLFKLFGKHHKDHKFDYANFKREFLSMV